jgi:hypothetical protein
MIINFRTRGISQGIRKLTWIPTLTNKKLKKRENSEVNNNFVLNTYPLQAWLIVNGVG